MAKKQLFPPFFLLFCLISFLLVYGIEKTPIINGGDLNNPNYWLCLTYNSLNEPDSGNQTVNMHDGVVDFWVNDTQGKWTYSKIQQGILPNGWTRKDAINEINISLDDMPNIYVRVIGNFSDPQFWNSTESWVNMGVAFWFEINPNYDVPNSVQMVVDIKFVSLKNNQTMMEDIAFNNAPTDNEYHYLTTSPQTFNEYGKYYDVTVNASDSFSRAFKYWNVKEAKLKCVEYWIEGYYGSGKAQLDFLDVWYEPKTETSNFPLALAFVPLILLFVALGVFKGMIR